MEHIEVVHQNYHMQGFSSYNGFMYWSFTDSLVKTTLSGTVKRQTEVHGGHLGDIDCFRGKIYASYLGFPGKGKVWDDWSSFRIKVYDCETLEQTADINLDICDRYKAIAGSGSDTRGFRGVDGVAFGKDPSTGADSMFVACAILTDERFSDQIILQFTPEGDYLREYRIPTGNTVFGIQNLDCDPETGEFWFSTYGREKPYQPRETLYRTTPDLKRIAAKYEFSSPYGFECMGGGKYRASLQGGVNGDRCGTAYVCDGSFFNTVKSESEINAYINGLING